MYFKKYVSEIVNARFVVISNKVINRISKVYSSTDFVGGRPRTGDGALLYSPIKMTVCLLYPLGGKICGSVPLRVLKSKMTAIRVVAVAFRGF